MSLYIASINSGSNGNCYYVGNGNEAVLIDAGISCRETEKRMARLNLSLGNVKAIFISHEHSDHINGLRVLSKKYNLPVYITEATLNNSRLNLEGELIRHFNTNDSFALGDLTVSAFRKKHDCADPHSFTVSGHGITIGIFTDIGAPCENLVYHFKKCHAAFLEANYDEEMLERGNYPVYLKRRIQGDHGHLSNRQALELFSAHKPGFMNHLFLSHLSRDNNDPQLVRDLFNKHAGGIQVVVASRFNESAVYRISDSGNGKQEETKLGQMSMF